MIPDEFGFFMRICVFKIFMYLRMSRISPIERTGEFGKVIVGKVTAVSLIYKVTWNYQIGVGRIVRIFYLSLIFF